MIAQEVNPIYKAVRDLESADQALVLQVIALLPRVRDSGSTIEVRAIRHEGWRVFTVRRQAIEKMS